jgi:TolB-like protein
VRGVIDSSRLFSDSRLLSSSASANSIAVMAFGGLSPARDQGYFSDGMAEEILNALARIKELRVLGRSLSFQYEGRALESHL